MMHVMLLLVVLSGSPKAPACVTLHGNEGSMLSFFAADDTRAIACIISPRLPAPGSTETQVVTDECVALNFDGGSFTTVTAPDGGSPVPTGGCLEGLCQAAAPPWPGPIEKSDGEQFIDVHESGTRRVRTSRNSAVVEVEAADGGVLASFRPTSPACPDVVFGHFIGDSVYAVAEGPKGPCEWVYPVKGPPRRVTWFNDFSCWPSRPKVHLHDDVWALASLRPNRIDLVHGATAQRDKSFALKVFDWSYGEPMRAGLGLHLGSTPCSTTPSRVEPLVKTPAGQLVYAASPGIALIDPVTSKTRSFLFKNCER